MPVLEWIGKEKVVNHANEVLFHVLERSYSYGVKGKTTKDNGSENKIIHGDNLLALKSLLPEYEGRVKCIYIDPPYNTGNEGWVYNDRVNDPHILKWLGEVVGKEGEDLSRHDKWLCMMYPRLKLLQRLLADDGAIFISIDDNEQANLRLICDEIFGQNNFVAQITLLCNPKGRSQDKYFATCHEYLLVYSKQILEKGSFNIEKDIEKINKDYTQEDETGKYRLLELRNTHREFGRINRPNLFYPIWGSDSNGSVSLNYDNEHTNEIYPLWPDGYEGCWTWGKELAEQNINLLVAAKKGQKWKVYRKAYAINDGEIVKQKLFSIWNTPEFYTEKGQNAFSSVFPGTSKNDFPQPKSVDYIMQVLKTATDKDSIILDSFAGSGTTAHAVLNLNKADGGNRKFILVEMMDYADTITAERVKRVIDGYGEGKKKTEGTGGAFSFYEVGEALFTDGVLNEDVDEEKIRAYIWYTETHTPYQKPTKGNASFLGCEDDTAYYFHYAKGETTTLDAAFLRSIKTKAERYVIYADVCVLSPEIMEKRNIEFKKIPRDIRKI